jgi:hypothetical protein
VPNDFNVLRRERRLGTVPDRNEGAAWYFRMAKQARREERARSVQVPVGGTTAGMMA